MNDEKDCPTCPNERGSAACRDRCLPHIVADVEHHRATLIAYLLAMVDMADWHAVSDAANDLRVLEASKR